MNKFDQWCNDDEHAEVKVKKPDLGDAEYKLKMNSDQMEKINSAED